MRIKAHHDVDTFPTREPISRNRRPAHDRRPRKSDARNNVRQEVSA